MQLTCVEFRHNESIPREYTCQGRNISPSLSISGLPTGTKSLALIMDDPDAPMRTWVHWVVFNIPPTARIEKGSIPGVQGINDFRKENYGGPCPPSGNHRYYFKLYALNARLDLPQGITKEQLEDAMEGHILDKAELIGTYQKH